MESPLNTRRKTPRPFISSRLPPLCNVFIWKIFRIQENICHALYDAYMVSVLFKCEPHAELTPRPTLEGEDYKKSKRERQKVRIGGSTDKRT